MRCVSQVGWHDKVFVLPDETFGDSDGEKVIFQIDYKHNHHFKVSGTLEGWRDNIARYCVGNSRLIFVVSTAFAGALLPICEESGGGFHLRATTSKGKSTALFVAGSVHGGNDSQGFFETWKATANGFESIAEMYNHGFLGLDEIKQCDARIVGDVAYMLANGKGKNRMTKGISLRRRLQWNLIFLSTGEISLRQMVESVGGQNHGGQEVRLCDLDADTGKFGLFEDLHGFEDGDGFSNHLRRASCQHYGVALREWLKFCVENRETIKSQWHDFQRAFVQTAFQNVGEVSGEKMRVARLFALVAFAGDFAHKITNWKTGAAFDAAIEMLKTWLVGRGEATTDAVNVIRQIRMFLESHGNSRFQPLENRKDTDGNPITEKINDRAGYKRLNAFDELEFLIMPETFKKIMNGFDVKFAAQTLIDNGLLMPDKDGNSTKGVHVPETRKTSRFYVISSNIFEMEKQTETEKHENFQDSSDIPF